MTWYSALGVGEQSIDVLPGADIVIVHGTNTFDPDNEDAFEKLDQLEEMLAGVR